MTKKTSWRGFPTVTGFGANQAIAALRKHRIAPAPLLHRAGLSAHDFGKLVEHRVSAIAQGKLLDYAAEAMEDGVFGLHLAEQADPRDAGILFYVASGGKNLNEALMLFARYFRIVNEAVRLKLTRRPTGLIVEIQFVGLSRHSVSQNTEFGIGVLLKALRVVTGRNLRPSRAAFAHARSTHLREFGRF
jgi:hypothetical protein